MLIFDTIVAECSAPYKSALSVIRMSGKNCQDILSHLISRAPSDLVPRMAYHLDIYSNKEDKKTLIDKGVVILFKGTNSFCGEDTAEFYVHGSRIIVRQLLDACVHYGARRAQGGEFSAKAYYNGKLELSEAEAINQIVNAQTVRSKNFALNTLQGDTSKLLLRMKDTLDLLTGEIEVNIDYPEYDDDTDLMKKATKEVPLIIAQASKLQAGSKQSLFLFNGIKVAIIGEPNVGKSTLLNKIIGCDKAIVTNIPGTTRDVVEGEKEIDGIMYKFFDTAGIRKGADTIEEIGIEKSYEICKEADIVLILAEKDSAIDEVEKMGIGDIVKTKPCIYVSTKKDLYGENKNSDISISKDDSSLDGLFKIIKEKLDVLDVDEAGFASQRDLDYINSFILTLTGAMEDAENGMTIDVIEIKLIEATKVLDEMLGKSSTMEDIYDTIFKHFCIGK